MGVENLPLKKFEVKIFLHIAEKVLYGHRKWEHMLKRAALVTRKESKRNVPGDSLLTLRTVHQLLKDQEPEVINQPPCLGRACP